MDIKKIILALLVLAAVGSIVFLLTSDVSLKCRVPLLKSFWDCQSAIDASKPANTTNHIGQKEIIADKPKIVPPKILYNLAGLVKSLEQDAVILDALMPYLDADGTPTAKTETKKVLITSATKFNRLIFVSQSQSNIKTPKETPIKFSDLKIGDSIEAISNKDITNKTELEAVLIRLLDKSQ